MNQGDLPLKLTVPCARCGREIVVSERRGNSYYSERRDLAGLCWGCSLDVALEKSRKESPTR